MLLMLKFFGERRSTTELRTSFIAYVVFASVLIGCERPRLPNEPEQVIRNGRVVFVGLPASDTRWDAVELGARNYLKSYSAITLTVLHPYDDSNDALIETCRSAASSRPHAICLWVANPDGAEAAVEAVAQASAAAITVGALPDSRLIFGHVQCSPVDAAELLGKELDEWAGAQRSYVVLHHKGRTRIATETFSRFQREASRHARLILLKDTTARADPAESDMAFRDLLQLFPNVGVAVTLDPRVWWNDPLCQELGSETRMATLGAPPALWPAIAGGKVAAAAWIDADAGRAAMEFAVQSLADHRKTNRITVIEPEWVTKETLPGFSNRYDAAKSGSVASRPANP